MKCSILLIPGTDFLPKTFTNIAVPKLVAETQSSIENQISVDDISHSAATTNMWTLAAGDPYITFTCHAINQ